MNREDVRISDIHNSWIQGIRKGSVLRGYRGETIAQLFLLIVWDKMHPFAHLLERQNEFLYKDPHLIRYDSRGSLDSQYTRDYNAQDLKAVADAVVNRGLGKKITLAGWSMIAATATLTGVVDLDLESGENILSLLVAADELEIHELIHHAQDNLIVKKSTKSCKDYAYHLSSRIIQKIKRTCLKMISEEPHMIFKSEDYLSLEESVLVSLLKRDDLAMDEIEIGIQLSNGVGVGDISNLGNQPVPK
ncbi:11583_t:CDS:2 [Ambispora gerdemannii]|uniref:11583_t:CDS:1 n=1 Tax=Ambispora gerdemannii TaxID=144530 RepID=A0A9N9FP30_9GLOM|nr:11583_t:CDS:2 [Ambispora gerdemannii]